MLTYPSIATALCQTIPAHDLRQLLRLQQAPDQAVVLGLELHPAVMSEGLACGDIINQALVSINTETTGLQ